MPSLLSVAGWLDWFRNKWEKTALLAEVLVPTWTELLWEWLVRLGGIQLFLQTEANTMLTFPLIQQAHHQVAAPFLSLLLIHISLTWWPEAINRFSLSASLSTIRTVLLTWMLRAPFFFLNLGLLSYIFFPPALLVCRQFTTSNKFPMPSKQICNDYLLVNTKHYCFILHYFFISCQYAGCLFWNLSTVGILGNTFFPSEMNSKTSL